MKTLLISTPQSHVTMEDARKFLPDMPEGWQMQVEGPENLHGAFPDAIVARMMPTASEGRVKTLIHKVAGMQRESDKSPFVIFAFSPNDWGTASSKPSAKSGSLWAKLQTSLKEFKHPERVDVAWMENSPGLAMRLRLIEAKLKLLDGKLNTAPRPSPLDGVDEVVKATEDLRMANGNLSATAVAKAFGVSLNQLAGWLGRTRQALSKTPDADSIQNGLAFFERVARLRAVVSADRFLKWLRMANAQLDGKTPLDLLACGEGQVVVDFVEDMMTGAPS